MDNSEQLRIRKAPPPSGKYDPLQQKTYFQEATSIFRNPASPHNHGAAEQEWGQPSFSIVPPLEKGP